MYTVRIEGQPHHLFLDFKRVVHSDSAAAAHPEYEAIAFYTRRHLDLYLRGGKSADAGLAIGVIPETRGVTGRSVRFTHGAPPPPREEDVLAWMRRGQPEHALGRVREALDQVPESRPVDPDAAFTVANFLQWTGERVQVADEARLIMLLEPEHANAQRLLETAQANLDHGGES